MDRNRARDLRAAEELAAGGWRVATLWECEIRDAAALAARLAGLLASAQPPAKG